MGRGVGSDAAAGGQREREGDVCEVRERIGHLSCSFPAGRILSAKEAVADGLQHDTLVHGSALFITFDLHTLSHTHIILVSPPSSPPFTPYPPPLHLHGPSPRASSTRRHGRSSTPRRRRSPSGGPSRTGIRATSRPSITPFSRTATRRANTPTTGTPTPKPRRSTATSANGTHPPSRNWATPLKMRPPSPGPAWTCGTSTR